MKGNEYLERYKCNPDKIEFEGQVYLEAELALMEHQDYEYVMEFGDVVEE